jgi:rhamnopyranosyl-N-acetylglucosaminyl-diphospho-decaprenol beta-1,3/1,4-galactofuranosyltransferase
MKQNKNSVCAVIVTYNRLETLKNALEHIWAQTVPPSTIVIVDNDSSDGTKEYIASIENCDSIRGLYLDRNIGYAGGIDYGMRYAFSLKSHDYFWIMDDDTFHVNNTLEDLINSIGNSDYGIVGLNGMKIKRGVKKVVESNERLIEVDYVLIDGALISSEVVQKVGTPSEKFFMMCEDWEYCLRIRKHGFKVGTLTNATIQRLYLGGQGGGYSKSTLWRGYYQARNHIIIMKDYFSFGHLYGYTVRQIRMIITALLYAPDRFLRAKLRILGIWHGIIGVEGKTLDPVTLKFEKQDQPVHTSTVYSGTIKVLEINPEHQYAEAN